MSIGHDTKASSEDPPDSKGANRGRIAQIPMTPRNLTTLTNTYKVTLTISDKEGLWMFEKSWFRVEAWHWQVTAWTANP
jgi:hypothetical protein